MTLLTEGRARSAAQRTKGTLQKSFSRVLVEASLDERAHFDIFLSHSIDDSELVFGTRSVLEGFGYTVYVDWIEDSHLDRAKVSRETAIHLKRRMKQCTSLLYLATENSRGSKWMPWELGFFDGFSGGRVTIVPISKDSKEVYVGQEYLGIYPYIDFEPDTNGIERPWVNRSSDIYGNFQAWLSEGPKAIRKRA